MTLVESIVAVPTSMTVSEKESQILETEEWKHFSKQLYKVVEDALNHMARLVARPVHSRTPEYSDFRGMFVTSLRQQLHHHGVERRCYFWKGEKKSFGRQIQDVTQHLLQTRNWIKPGVLKPPNYLGQGGPLMASARQIVEAAYSSQNEEFQECWTQVDQIRTDVAVMTASIDSMKVLADRAQNIRKKINTLCGITEEGESDV
jgi:hypothetical protein